MYFRDKNGLKINRLYIDANNNEYGIKWLSGATDEQLLELEITKHDDPIRPDYDESTQAISMGDDGEYIVRDLTQSELDARKPRVVDMAQARLALLQSGLLASVDAAIDSMPSPEKEAALVEWNFRGVVSRDSDLVANLSLALGLTETDLDNLFALAVTL